MILYFALLGISALGCIALICSPRHGVREMISTTIAIAPINAIIFIYLLRHI